MSTTAQLIALFQVGWSLQVAPEVGAWGVVYAQIVWHLKRDEMNETLDGPVAGLPLMGRVNLVSGGDDGFAAAVERLYRRVFPISPFGDLGDDGGDVPEREK